MKKRFLITEEEKKSIRNLYNLNESLVDDFIGYIKDKGPEVINKVSDFFGLDNDKEETGKSEDSKKSLESEVSKMTPDDIKKFSKMVKYGDVKIKGPFDAEQKQNISLLIDEMKKNGITNPYAQIGILSVINKESNFKPKGEVSYGKTSNSRIRNIFGNRVKKYSDDELDKLKKDSRKFFNVVYAKTVGNQGGEDGWFYRGRGFNQLTGKKNYEKWSGRIGFGDKLVEDPELLNKPEIAAKLAVAFLIKDKTNIPNFTSKEEAAAYFADVNSGNGGRTHRHSAINKSKNFDVSISNFS